MSLRTSRFGGRRWRTCSSTLPAGPCGTEEAMHALLLLTVANIKSFVRDRAALFWTLAFPLIFVFLFGSIFSGGDSSRTIGFADLDGSPASAQLSAAFAAAPNVELVDGTEEDLLSRMRDGELSAVIVVPKGYAETVAAKQAP